MVQALGLDVYNTLFRNEADLWLGTFEDICRVQGLEVPPRRLWETWKGLEVRFRAERVNLDAPEASPPFRPYYEVWRECFREAFALLGLRGDPEQAVRMAVVALGCRPPYPETLDILARLRERWRLAVLSNADNAFLYPLLRRWGLTFEAVLTSEGVRAYKPHPRAFAALLEHLGLPAERVVYVGDTPLDDVEGARRAGLVPIWLNRDGRPWPEGLAPPPYTLTSLEGLVPLLETLP